MQYVTLSARKLKAANVLVDKKQPREAIKGVLVECGKTHVFYVATDNRAMVVMHDERQDRTGEWADGDGPATGSFIIPHEVIAKINLWRWRPNDFLVLRIAPGDATKARLDDREISLIDGQFPNWRRVIPQHTEERVFCPVQHNFKLLAKFTKVSETMGWNSPFLHPSSGSEPGVITWGQERAFGLIMPLRLHAESNVWHGAPEWLNDKETE